MSWEELIHHFLSTSSTIYDIVIYDLKGRPVAITDSIETCESEGFALVKCVCDPTNTMTKLHISGHVLHCFHGINKTIFGRNMKDASALMVAQQEGDHIIVLMGHSDGQASFLLDLTEGLRRKAEGTLIGQQQQQPPQQTNNGLLPMPPSSPHPRNPVNTQEVLVDITT